MEGYEGPDGFGVIHLSLQFEDDNMAAKYMCKVSDEQIGLELANLSLFNDKNATFEDFILSITEYNDIEELLATEDIRSLVDELSGGSYFDALISNFFMFEIMAGDMHVGSATLTGVHHSATRGILGRTLLGS